MNLLALSWAGIIAFGVVLYVILDGFDLGIGILSIFIKNEADRDIMISSILPVWDGNETWLVFGTAALYGAFPLAFSEMLPAFYLPFIIMVVALLFRGVAFEFRLKANKSKFLWENAFYLGSIVTTIVQGFILGTFVQGFNFSPLQQELYPYVWFNKFGVFCAVALIFGYMLLASNWLIIKTEGALQEKFYKISSMLQYFMVLFAVIVSIITPLVDPAIAEIWFDPQKMPYLSILPMTTILFFFLHWYGLKKHIERLPFWSCIGVFATCYIGFIISVYPYIVPRRITYLEAAANDKTLGFMLIGAVIMLPILLFYTYYAYHLFKGKITQHLEY